MKKDNHANSNHKKARMTILIPDTMDFKTKMLLQIKKRTFYNNNEAIHQKYIIIINIYSPNNRIPKHIKQKLIKMKTQITQN